MPLSINSTMTCSRRVWECSNAVENSPRTVSKKQEGERSENRYYFPDIICIWIYFWPTVTPGPNKRETLNLKLTMSWSYTIEQGSCPLLVMYVFCASTFRVYGVQLYWSLPLHMHIHSPSFQSTLHNYKTCFMLGSDVVEGLYNVVNRVVTSMKATFSY